MAQRSPGLSARPVGRHSTSLVNGTSMSLTSLNGHARRARKSRLGSGLGCPLVCAVAAIEPEIIEETVDGIAVIEQPGSLPSTQFEAFDQATGLVEDLEMLNAQMVNLIKEASIAVEVQQETSKWPGNTLPDDVQQQWTVLYRQNRKKDRQESRAARRLNQVLRAVGTTQSHPAISGQEADGDVLSPQWQPQPAADVQQHMQAVGQPARPDDAAGRRARRAQQREQRVNSVAPAVPTVEQPSAVTPLHAPEQLAQQQATRAQPSRSRRLSQAVPAQPAAQQPPSRQRRRRTASAAAAATLAPAAAVAPAPLQVSSSPVQETQQPMQQASAASRGGLAVRPVVASTAESARSVSAPAAAAAVSAAPAGLAISSSTEASSSSTGSLAVPSTRRPARGFQPLSLQQSSAAASARSSVARRTVRAAGISSSRATAAATATKPPPAVSADAMGDLPKLVDNNMHGLDMRAELLTADQEKELAVMVQDLLVLEGKQRELAQQLGRVPSDVEWMTAAGCGPKDDSEQAFREAVHAFESRLAHGRSAKQVMISANYKLVVSISRKYQGFGMALHDLINEGITGLVKGVERFEPSKGCKFSTYAHWWIRQAITRSLSDQGRLVRLPSHLQEMLTRMTRVSRNFESHYGREPTLDELAREMGVEPHKIQDTYEAVFVPKSLDSPMNDGEGATLGDVIEDERMLDAEDSAYMEALKADLEAVLLTLPPREAGVLRMRFGLLDGTEHTLDDIGAQYNVTRERIRQIEAKAIRQLRARQTQTGSVMADYQSGGMSDKEMASRTSSGTKKQG